MSYLVKLKKIESEKNFNKSSQTKVPKVSEVPFDTFDTSNNEEIKKNLMMIQSWLYQITEPDEDHFLVLDKSRTDPEVMEYFLKHVRDELSLQCQFVNRTINAE